MKEKDYDNENLVSFRELAEKIKSFADSELDEDEIIEDVLTDGGFAQLFGQILSGQLRTGNPEVLENLNMGHPVNPIGGNTVAG